MCNTGVSTSGAGTTYYSEASKLKTVFTGDRAFKFCVCTVLSIIVCFVFISFDLSIVFTSSMYDTP